MSISLKVYKLSHKDFKAAGFRYEYVGDYPVKPVDFEFLYVLEDKVFSIIPEPFSVASIDHSSPLDKYDCNIVTQEDFNVLENKNIKSMLKSDIQAGINNLDKEFKEFPYICFQRH